MVKFKLFIGFFNCVSNVQSFFWNKTFEAAEEEAIRDAAFDEDRNESCTNIVFSVVHTEKNLEVAPNLEKSELDEKKLLRRRYLYTTNYALLHSDTEVAPFLALTELYNVNIKLLDTINNSLTEKVKTSKYGKQLNEFVLKIKSQEN